MLTLCSPTRRADCAPFIPANVIGTTSTVFWLFPDETVIVSAAFVTVSGILMRVLYKSCSPI